MNLLIIADKSDIKTYHSVVKAVPNISVLGTVTKLNAGFVAELQSKYNPHAIIIDTAVSVNGISVQALIESIAKAYPYMKLLVLTDETDSCRYTSYCTIKGRVSSIEIKEILGKMTKDESYSATTQPQNITPDIDGSAPTEELNEPPSNIFRSKMDNLSTSVHSARIKRSHKIRLNPIITAAVVGAAALVIIIVAVIIKNGKSESIQAATDDEAYTIETTIATTTEHQGLYDTAEQLVSSAIVPTTVTPPTTQQPTQPMQTAKSEVSQSKSAAEMSEDSEKRSSDTNSDNNSAGYYDNSDASVGSNSSNNEQQQNSYIGGDPEISYNDGNYHNSKSNEVSSIKLSYSSKTMSVGDTLQLTATVSPSSADQTLTWSTSNSSVVSVSSSGYLTARQSGNATVTATANNGKSASCAVSVQNAISSKDVHLSAAEYNLSVDQTVTVTLYGADNVKWDMDNNYPLYIVSHKNNYMVFRARTAGTVKLTATDMSTGTTYTCIIRVK